MHPTLLHASAGAHGDVSLAVRHLLCSSDVDTFEGVPDYTGRNGVGGLFSQLNYLAQEVLERLYKRQRPSASFHDNTLLHGYGSSSLSKYFHALPCSTHGIGVATADALATIERSPRHLVVSHLLHALYRPRLDVDGIKQTMTSSIGRGGIDLALHVRRGDKLTEFRAVDKIKIWDEDMIVEEVRRRLGRDGSTVLIASDDDAFTKMVCARLQSLGYNALRQGNENQRFDGKNHSVEAAQVCDGTCVPPLLSLVRLFSRAKFLAISSRSNIGSFLLSWWSAANGDAIPSFVDLDNGITPDTLASQGRYFCSLPWGSRRGLCRGKQMMCDLPHLASRSFCGGANVKMSG